MISDLLIELLWSLFLTFISYAVFFIGAYVHIGF